MFRIAHMRRWALLPVLIAATQLGAPLAAQEPEADPAEAFAKDFERVRRSVKGRNYKTALSRLERLLEEHADAGYARSKAPQIRALTKQCLFRHEYGVPHPRDLVSGKLVSYNLATGRIKIRYDRGKQVGDFVVTKNLWIHKARFKGRHSLTFEGESYGRSATVLQALVCMDDRERFLVVPGVQRYTTGRSERWLGSSIEHWADGKKTQLASKDSPCVKGKPFKIRIGVNETSIKVSYRGRTILTAKKSRDAWGYVGMTLAYESMTIEGRAEPSWIQGMIDAKDQEHLAEFEKTYDAADHLPAWVLAPAAPSASDSERLDWPVELKGADRVLVTTVTAQRKAGQHRKALRLLDTLPENGVSDALRLQLTALVCRDLGWMEEALEAAEDLVASEPGFVRGQVLRAQLLAEQGDRDEAEQRFRELLERHPDDPALHVEAALFLMQSAKPQEARELLDGAIARGLESEDLIHCHRLAAMALRGPSWSRVHQFQSKNYLVLSNIDKTTCRQASTVRERAYQEFSRRFGRVESSERRRFRVYLFRGQQGYAKYCVQLWGRSLPRTAGLYDRLVQQLLIWNLPEREEMMRTVRHEGFHQYLHRVIESPPLWFNEGLAEYFEAAETVRGKLRTGFVPREHLKSLREQGAVPFSELLEVDDAAFMRDPARHYASGWAAIQFLLETTPDREKLFRKFWAAYRDHPSRRKANGAALEGLDPKRLDEEFQRFVGGMLSGE